MGKSNLSRPKRKRNPEELRARRLARALQIPWSDVIAQRKALQAAEKAQRADDDEARKVGWYSWLHWNGWSDSHRKYWRSGFQRVLGPRMARGADITSIPKYDLIAASVREQCPKFAEWDTADIWDLLLSEYPQLRPVEEHWRNAMALLAANELTESVPF